MILIDAAHELEKRPRRHGEEASGTALQNEMNKLLREQTLSKTSKYFKMVREQAWECSSKNIGSFNGWRAHDNDSADNDRVEEDNKSYKKIIRSTLKAANANLETWIVGTSKTALLKAYRKAIKMSQV